MERKIVEALALSGTGTKYQELQLKMQDLIRSGVWRLGSRLPSDNELMDELGLSRATVRQALDGLVKEGLVERVRGKGSYVADRHPAQLSVNVYSLHKPAGMGSKGFYGVVLPQIMVECGKHGITPKYVCLDELTGDTPTAPGIVLGDMIMEYRDKLPKDQPLVFVDSEPYSPESLTIHVVSRNLAGASEAVRALVARGRRRIAYIGDPHPNYQLRYAGYCQGLALSGIMLDPALAWQNSRDGIAALAADPGQVDAVFCCSDSIAVSLLTTLQGSGVSIPEDISLIAFDGTAMGELLKPSLSTVAVDRREMAVRAVEELMAALKSSVRTQKRVEVATVLVLRDSTPPS